MNKIVPNHIAIIMDGNGRWAQNRGLPRTFGHKEGAVALRKVIAHAGKLGVKYLTVYAFSTENWKRSQEEVNALMFLFKTYIKKEEKNIVKNNIKFMVSGRSENVNPSLLQSIRDLEEKTKDNDGLTFNIAFNYGGRAEIIDAVNKILESKKTEIKEEEFSDYLYNKLPDPELLIRTSGEMRISNFLLWQIAYSELYITDTFWPDFNEIELEKAIEDFNKRNRRFGGTK